MSRFEGFRFNLGTAMTQAEVHHLIATVILSCAEENRPISPPGLASAEDCAVQIGIPQSDREQFRRLNASTFPHLASPFINKLIRVGILEPDWALGPALHRLNSERQGTLEMFTTIEGLATAEFMGELQDDELRARCASLVVITGSPDTLIREAVTVLEDRLRSILGPADRVDRRDLAAKVLHPRTGVRNVVGDDESARQEDFFYLVRGILGFYGTPAHHRLQPDLPPERARRVVALIDEILATLGA